MMISHRDSKKNNPTWIFLVVCVGVVALLVLWPSIQKGVLYLFESVHINESYVYTVLSKKMEGISMYARSNTALYYELRATQAELQIERQKYLEIPLLQARLQAYEKSTVSTTDIVYATRIGTIGSRLSPSFRINLENSVLCASGAYVTSLNQILLGTLETRDVQTSLVSLAWGANSINARLGTTGDILTLAGNYDGTYTARVARTISVKEGEIVILDAKPEIIIGTIIDIDTNESESFMNVIIGIPFSPSRIDKVKVHCSA